jgi:hypothetical protein
MHLSLFYNNSGQKFVKMFTTRLRRFKKRWSQQMRQFLRRLHLTVAVAALVYASTEIHHRTGLLGCLC